MWVPQTFPPTAKTQPNVNAPHQLQEMEKASIPTSGISVGIPCKMSMPGMREATKTRRDSPNTFAPSSEHRFSPLSSSAMRIHPAVPSLETKIANTNSGGLGDSD